MTVCGLVRSVQSAIRFSAHIGYIVGLNFSIRKAMGGNISSSAAAAFAHEDPGVASFHSAARWQRHLNSIKESNILMVIDFTAAWCGPCKFMEPAFEAMADKYRDVKFAKIDVDELPEVSRGFGVAALPTFVLLKGGKVVDRVVGAKKDELERKINWYMST